MQFQQPILLSLTDDGRNFTTIHYVGKWRADHMIPWLKQLQDNYSAPATAKQLFSQGNLVHLDNYPNQQYAMHAAQADLKQCQPSATRHYRQTVQADYQQQCCQFQDATPQHYLNDLAGLVHDTSFANFVYCTASHKWKFLFCDTRGYKLLDIQHIIANQTAVLNRLYHLRMKQFMQTNWNKLWQALAWEDRAGVLYHHLMQFFTQMDAIDLIPRLKIRATVIYDLWFGHTYQNDIGHYLLAQVMSQYPDFPEKSMLNHINPIAFLMQSR